MTVQAGERLGLFARTGQLSLKSGEKGQWMFRHKTAACGCLLRRS